MAETQFIPTTKAVPMKAGWQTTEFWTTLLAMAPILLVTLGIVPANDQNQISDAASKLSAGLIGAVAIYHYIKSRMTVKTAASIALLSMGFWPVEANAQYLLPWRQQIHERLQALEKGGGQHAPQQQAPIFIYQPTPGPHYIGPAPQQQIPLGPVPQQHIPLGPQQQQQIPLGLTPQQQIPIGGPPGQQIPIGPSPQPIGSPSPAPQASPQQPIQLGPPAQPIQPTPRANPSPVPGRQTPEAAPAPLAPAPTPQNPLQNIPFGVGPTGYQRFSTWKTALWRPQQ